MAVSAIETLASRIASCTVVSTVEALDPMRDILEEHGATVMTGSHPMPDASSVAAGRHALALLQSNTSRDPVVALISGGASSLMVAPAESISIEDYAETTRQLQYAGASIHELNCVRKHIDSLKGGGLARASHGAPIVCLVISDVIGNDASVIASGPFAADPSTFADAIAVLDRYGLTDSAPKAITSHLLAGRRGEMGETLKPEDGALANVRLQILSDNTHAVDAAASYARRLGYNTVRLNEPVTGPAAEAGARLAATLGRVTEPTCLIAGGETTVVVRGNGKGGRNQELCLAAAVAIDMMTDVVLLSGGTDGIDGATDVAGGIVDGGSCARMQQNGVDATTALDRNDSWTALSASDDLLVTGPTGTNVMDVQIVLRTPVDR
jgi:hydroxypyruvate reductase